MRRSGGTRDTGPFDNDSAADFADDIQKSVFGLLKAPKLTFTNPTARILAQAPGPVLPMPLNVDHIRWALNSTDPVQALLCALAAFHGLRSGQLRLLKLTDIDGDRLSVDDRVIVLAAPVRERLTAYLTHRTARWPATANPYLFTHPQCANGTDPVGPRFVYTRLGPHLNTRDLRTDRLLQEALAGGDAKRIRPSTPPSATPASWATPP